MKKSRIALLLVCLVFTVAIFAGCTPSPKGETYEIVWYNMSSPKPDDARVFEKISEYTKEKINVTVKYTALTGNEFKQKVPLMLGAGDKLDLVFTASYQGFIDNVANQYYMPLDDLINKYGKELKKVVPEAFWNGVTVDKKIYAIPTTKESAHQTVLTFQDAIVKKYGFDVAGVKKLEDIEPMLAKVKADNAAEFPLYYTAGYSLFNLLPFDPVTDQLPGAFNVQTGEPKVINQYLTDEAKQYFATVRDFYNKGYVRKDIDTVKETRDVENTNRYFIGIAATLPYLEDMMNKGTDYPFKWGYNLSYPITAQGDLMGSMQAIPASCKNPEAVMKFLNLLNTDAKLRNMVAYGIEGEHWFKVGDSQWKYPDNIKNNNEAKYGPYNFTIGNMFITYTQSGSQPVDLWQKYDEFSKSAKKSPGLGFLFNGKEFTTELSALKNVFNEFMPSLLTGASDPNVKLAEAMEKFKVAGLETYMKAAQEQYDATKK